MVSGVDVLEGGMTDTPSEDPSRFGGWRLAANRWVWRASIFTMGPFVVWLERVLPNRHLGARMATLTARAMNHLVGAKVEVRGLERLDPRRVYMLTPNHRSAFDIVALLGALPGARFAAKRELFDDRTLGPPMRALGMIALDRGDPDAAKRALEQAAAGRGRMTSVIMFPEGTIGPRNQLLPFKSGAFVFAIRAGIPVVPVAVHNSGSVMPNDGGISIPGGNIVVEVLDPLPTDGMTDDDRTWLKERARKAISEALRPEDGGVAARADLGGFGRRAIGVTDRRPPEGTRS